MIDPAEKFGHLLFLVSRAHHNLASKVFGEIGLNRGQPPVLFEIGKSDGIVQSDLASKLEMTQATLTNLLQRMERAGFISRVRDQADTRLSRVYLTETGKDVLVQAKILTERMDQTVLKGFSLEEQGLLNNMLNRIHFNLTESK